MHLNFSAPCLFGLESLVAQELRDMGAADVAAENGRVFFSGDEAILARANICSRFSERILLVLGRFTAHTFEELFQGVKKLPLENWIGEYDEFPVKGYCLKSDLHSVSDCQAIIKKAAVERLKTVYHKDWFEETGARCRLDFSILKNEVCICIDTTGVPLHKRGYRPAANDAPMRETLAAALCALSHLRPYHTLYDPMCGSGTILIEGAMLALNIAPGVRRHFAAERFSWLPAEVWEAERERAREQKCEATEFTAYGSDIDRAALKIARENALRAGVSDFIVLEHGDVRHFSPKTERGTLVTNPPYGERLQDPQAAARLVREMGNVFERRHGFSYSVISPEAEFETLFGRKADKRRKLYNGMIPCQLYMYFK